MDAYKELLKTANWQKRRSEIFRRDNFKCQCAHCKHKGTQNNPQLEVHHIDYWSGKKPWEYPDDMLITLCQDCHKLEHIRNLAEDGLLKALKYTGFLYGDFVAFAALIYRDEVFRNSIISKIRQIQNG